MVYSYLAAKVEKKEKVEEKVTMRLKMNFSSHWLMVRLNLISDNVRNCEETTTFMKEFEKIIKSKKKGILNLAYKQRFLFKNQNSLISSKNL